MSRRWRSWWRSALLAAVFCLSGLSVAADEAVFVLGTAPVAGAYFPAGGAVCRLVNAKRDEHGLRCLIESTAGSAENLRRLKTGDLDLALLQSDWQYHAYRGTIGAKDGPAFAGLRSLFSLHAQPITIVAARESGVGSVSDLLGKRVSLGPLGSAMRRTSEALVLAFGWPESARSEALDLAPDDQVEALCAGLIDAFVMPTSHPSGLVAAAAEGCLARLIPVEGEAVDALLARLPFFARASIAGGLYRGNPDRVGSFGVRATLVAAADQPADLVYQVVREVFERLDELKGQHPALATLVPETMVESGNSAPFHDGALRYYRERGWK